jgi:hypothetical protein
MAAAHEQAAGGELERLKAEVERLRAENAKLKGFEPNLRSRVNVAQLFADQTRYLNRVVGVAGWVRPAAATRPSRRAVS